jgi:hypothetical protein
MNALLQQAQQIQEQLAAGTAAAGTTTEGRGGRRLGDGQGHGVGELSAST